jgi:hypothetical protein
MGNTESTSNVYTQNNQLTMNRNDFNSNVEQINSTISSTSVEQAKSCSAAMNLGQYVNFEGITTGGDFTLDVNQNMSAALTFNCVNSALVRQVAGSNIITGITDAVANSADNQMIQALDSKAKTNSDAGFMGGIGNIESNTNVTSINNTTTVNQSVVNLNKVVKNIVENKFSTKTIDTCISNVNSTQDANVKRLTVGGNAVIAIRQDMAIKSMTDCLQQSSIGAEIMNEAKNALGVSVVNENKSSASQEAKSSAASETKTEGVGTALNQTLGGLAGVVDSVGGAVGSILGGILSGPMMIIGAIVLCCLLCCASSFLLPKLMGGSAPPPGAVQGVEMATSDMNGEMGQDMGGDMGQGMGADMGPGVGTSV